MPSNFSENAPCSLIRLPRELLHAITSHLTNSDIKHLRAASKAFQTTVLLRLDRVFLSANPLNIRVFRAIADHEDFRHRVKEIVWDDARLTDTDYSIDTDYGLHRINPGLLRAKDIPEDCPAWFERGRRDTLMWRFNVVEGGWNGNTIPDDVMSLEDCWQYYKKLIKEQKAVLETAADIEALRYGLHRFPSLRRMTLTPAAHGLYMGNPLYQTPMFRAFPETFAYPIPRGWPGNEETSTPPEIYGWGHDEEFNRLTYGPDGTPREDPGCTLEEYKNIWRGFRVILRTLAQCEHSISEFVMAIHHRSTGMNCHIFDRPCQEYHDFVALVSKPGFRRLDLALCTGFQEGDEWCSFRSGLLRDALAAATGLEHFSISSDMDIDASGFPSQIEVLEDDSKAFLPLLAVFPVKNWPRLKHFGIIRFYVYQSELMTLFEALPFSLRSLEVSYMAFVEDGSGYMTLLNSLREKLSWKDRAPGQRPQIQIRLDRDSFSRRGRYVSVDKAASSFIYSDASRDVPNPFGKEVYSLNLVEGLGAVDRSHLAPSFEIPFTVGGGHSLELIQYQPYI
ncbi:Cyclin-like F-box [Cordyceps militaris]|uniref:Cyclin-like F-box n=1 Tax=Cordyceps militaris TaxID=73501 RepID=A0A2H4SD94_CORMI|nr:Cyclin-like F-box [Cordyceps militaris]